MKVLALSINAAQDSEDQRLQAYREHQLDYFITSGMVYTVYGVEWRDDAVWYLLENVSGYLEPVPAVFFTLTDPRASRYWVLTIRGAAAFFYPKEFEQDEYYFDRLSDLDPTYLGRWGELRRKLDDEANESS